jgi:hypothetical protein
MASRSLSDRRIVSPVGCVVAGAVVVDGAGACWAKHGVGKQALAAATTEVNSKAERIG